jgi:predicted nucleic acid-binding protein
MTKTKVRGGLVTFNDLPAGATVFIDTNCLVYAATADATYGTACQQLLDQIDNKVFQGCTSAAVLGELSHRLMTLEAALLFQRPMSGIANWLRRHPSEVQQLSQYRLSIDDLQAIPIVILPVSGALVSRAADFSRLHGLLTNDALIVAVMQDHGLTHLASLDADFDRVPGITRYAPV